MLFYMAPSHLSCVVSAPALLVTREGDKAAHRAGRGCGHRQSVSPVVRPRRWRSARPGGRSGSTCTGTTPTRTPCTSPVSATPQIRHLTASVAEGLQVVYSAISLSIVSAVGRAQVRHPLARLVCHLSAHATGLSLHHRPVSLMPIYRQVPIASVGSWMVSTVLRRPKNGYSTRRPLLVRSK
jgi:hypothetical protein